MSPVQTFRWGNYTAKPDHDDTYRAVAMRSRPDALLPSDEVTLRVRTEGEATRGPHRGVQPGCRRISALALLALNAPLDARASAPDPPGRPD